MAKMADRNLLTIGALFVIIVVSVLLYVPTGLLTAWWMVFATMIVLFGFWLIALAVMQRSNPEKYGRGAFSYFGWGLLLIALGGAWFLYTYNWIYSLAVILLVLAALAIAAAFRRK
jgi:cobalamin synthase